MSLTARRERVREILAGDRCIHPASVYDPVSARIAEDLGFEAGMFAGSVASLTVLGAPDIALLTLTELAQQIRRICRAGDLSLLADADHGYGNALNVMRAVEELEAAGVSALTIEDTNLPRRFGRGDGVDLCSVEEGVGKMKAALAGRRDPALVVAGRTGALAAAGVDDCIRRIQAYAEAGVDAIFLVGVRTAEELAAVSGAVSLPLLLGGTGPGLTDADLLAANRVRIALQGHAPFAAAVRAVHETLAALRNGVAPGDLSGIADGELMGRVARRADYDAWTEAFLT